MSQREASSKRSEEASSSIAALSPILNQVKERIKRLEAHIAETTHECSEVEEASKHLVAVRKLIISLEKCPGQD